VRKENIQKKENKKSSGFTTVLLFIVLIVGLALLLYPTVSDYWNSFTQSKAVASYAEKLNEIDEDQYAEIWNSAIAYNEKLKGLPPGLALTPELESEYYQMLAVDESGIMGLIEIPSINVSLPIYHGTGDEVLQVAIGHIDWTSLPTGGMGNHTVVSGHRGLPSAKLFTNLDQLREGDIFMLRVLDEILTYEIDMISIIEPHEVDSIKRHEDMDLCTLMTCTPYGINTHRLLVRGHRVENIEEAKIVRIVGEARQIDPLIVAPIVASPMLLVLFIFILIPRRGKNKKYDESRLLDIVKEDN